ncbi:MAG: redox-regulated ATPase YchF [Desulfovibrionaceae bacterium]|nr:redox-regulated ATPase YchF [Desulfovibrionaceae bacterium]
MALSIGIVGLPNVGKSTLFNALTKAQNAQAANFPFCTIEPNKATVPVPDARLIPLEKIARPQRVIQATVDFIDIAGLVRGASKGEGLGNQFLANIRECAAIVEVVRCFEDENITHVDGAIDPLRDIETIETELLLADIQTLERRIERTARMAKGSKEMAALTADLEKLMGHLDTGGDAASFAWPEDELMAQTRKELGLLTDKKIIYCANVDEAGLASSNRHLENVRKYAASKNAEVVVICARLEEDLQGLSEEEQLEMLASYGAEEDGLSQIIHTGYRTLGLLSYFTVGEKEVRAWTIENGWKAPQAAGVIHTDFERGFIRAEVIAYDDFIRCGSEAACRSAGLLRVEGKEYVVQDGDVVHFLFNV